MAGKWTRWLLGGSAATLALGASAASAEGFRHHQDYVLGASLDFVASTHDQEAGQRALAAALGEVARLDAIFSNWSADSELAALNSSSSFQASPELFAVIDRAERARELTNGTFSARLGAVTEHWREAAVRGEQPDAARLSGLARDAASAELSLDPASRTIGRPQAVRLDLDGVAKGYVIDRALQAAREAAPDVQGFMLNIGGDIATWGADPAGQSWRIGVARGGVVADNAAPAQVLELSGHAIAFSGSGARDFQIADQQFSHLLASHGGSSRQNLSAAVIAPTAEQADALATALAIMPAQDGIELLRSIPDVAALITDSAGQTLQSETWAQFSPQACQSTPASTAATWPQEFAVSISYEVPRMNGDTKPYTAMWITDQQGNIVRTLLVVGDQARWREMNYIFWRRIERMNMAGIQSIARPTRAPGRYNVVWDGLDNAGRPVAQGQYNLNIEVNREHGSHNFQAIPLNLSAAPVQSEAAAQSEIGTVQVRYGRPS